MEARPLKRLLALERTASARVVGETTYRGSLHGRAVVAVVTGMGTALARDATLRLVQGGDIDRVIVVGITGAVDNETPIGTLVSPAEVLDSATGDSFTPHPLAQATPSGVMWTTDELTEASQLPALRERGVISLDMETAAVARVCEEHDIAWSVFRAISDRASDGSVDAEVFGLSRQDGTPEPRALARYLLVHPNRIPGLVRLARGSRLATRVAADAAVRACDSLRDEQPTNER